MKPEEPPSDGPGQATVKRYVDDEHVSLFVRGHFGAMFKAYCDHVRLWQELPDGLSLVMMRQALGAASLHLSCRPTDETTAWTLNVKTPPLNLFVTGDAAGCNVTGRVFTEGVETAGSSRLFVESRRARGEPYRSVIDVTGLDVLDIFEQFSRRSDQNHARYFELEQDDYLMVVGFPGSSGEWLQSLERGTAAARYRELPTLLDQKTFWFKCGCHFDRILEVVRQLYGDRPEELFRGESHVDVFCPRCGRRWALARERFDHAG